MKRSRLYEFVNKAKLGSLARSEIILIHALRTGYFDGAVPHGLVVQILDELVVLPLHGVEHVELRVARVVVVRVVQPT